MNFLDRFAKKKAPISRLIKIRPVGTELFHTDRRTNMNLIDAFRNFANAPKIVVTAVLYKYNIEVGSWRLLIAGFCSSLYNHSVHWSSIRTWSLIPVYNVTQHSLNLTHLWYRCTVWHSTQSTLDTTGQTLIAQVMHFIIMRLQITPHFSESFSSWNPKKPLKLLRNPYLSPVRQI